MKKFSNLLLLSFITILSTIFTSCSKTETTDVRDPLVGTYSYKANHYDNSTGELKDSSVGTATVSKHATDGNSIEFKEGGALMFSGIKIQSASNGVVFDIPSQSFKEKDGTSVQMAGTQYVTLGTTKYHAAYFTATSTIETAFTFTGRFADVQATFLVTFQFTKK